MTQYLHKTRSTGEVTGSDGFPDPPGFEGPPHPARPTDTDGIEYVPWQGKIVYGDQPTPTSKFLMTADGPRWVETGPLRDVILYAIDAIDTAADQARQKVLSKQTNSEEYRQVEPLAVAFRAAGYPEDDVPRDIASWVKAKRRQGWTARQATDDILSTRDQWRDLLSDIREARLVCKEDVRNAVDEDEVKSLLASFTAELYALMAREAARELQAIATP